MISCFLFVHQFFSLDTFFFMKRARVPRHTIDARSPRIRINQIFFSRSVYLWFSSARFPTLSFVSLKHWHTQKHSCGGYEKLSRRGKCPRSWCRIALEIRNSESKKERDRCVLRESWKESEIDFVPLFLLLISNKKISIIIYAIH